MTETRIINNHSKAKTLTKAILLTIGTGTVLMAALVAPNAVQILQPLLGESKRKNYERERIRQALRALHKRRLIEYVERKNETYVYVTEKGKTRVQQFQIDALSLPQKEWDKRWRLIFFDIPEAQGKARRAFQKQLRSLGCLPIQKSIFVYPHACQDEIDFVASFWGIQSYIRYIETDDLGRSEGETRKFFGLL